MTLFVGLPIEMRQRQNYINFVGATEKGDIMDVVKLVREDIQNLNEFVFNIIIKM